MGALKPQNDTMNSDNNFGSLSRAETANEPLTVTKPSKKTCVLSVHDEQFSKDDVLVNADFLTDTSLTEGTLVSISVLGPRFGTSGHQGLLDGTPERRAEPAERREAAVPASESSRKHDSDTSPTGYDLPRSANGDGAIAQKEYLFYLKEMGHEQRAKGPLNIQVCAAVPSLFSRKTANELCARFP